MNSKIPKNPFATKNYYGKAYFCDREKETKEIISRLTNNNAVSLIAMRRIGKTGLIKHIAESLSKDYKLTYIDILQTESMQDFLELITTSLLNEFPEKTRFGKKIWNFIKSLRPTIKFDSLSGEPQALFPNTDEPQKSIDQIFKYLETADYKIIIALDEFQQILKYPQKNIDAWLRTRMQELKNITFIFSGSQQHLMTELFTDYNKPFYRSTQTFRLEKIENEIYCNFIIKMFKRYKKNIAKDTVYEMLDWTDTHTFYVQELCNSVFALNKDTIESQDWKNEARKLLKNNELTFFAFREMLTKHQWNLLTAIAINQPLTQPTAQKFIKENGLSGSATILKSLDALIKIGIVFKDFDKEGTSYYGVYDVYFRRWAERKFKR